jgi:hypothetical protein
MKRSRSYLWYQYAMLRAHGKDCGYHSTKKKWQPHSISTCESKVVTSHTWEKFWVDENKPGQVKTKLMQKMQFVRITVQGSPGRKLMRPSSQQKSWSNGSSARPWFQTPVIPERKKGREGGMEGWRDRGIEGGRCTSRSLFLLIAKEK